MTKLTKCIFATNQVSYLGHIISEKGVSPNPKKVSAIQNWSQPCSLTNLRGFLSLTRFYRKFIQHYATFAAPLTDLLQHKTFTWAEPALKAFEKLKLQIARVFMLKLPNFTLPFVVETNASTVAMGAILILEGHPLSFFNKKVGSRLQASSMYICEMYAIKKRN